MSLIRWVQQLEKDAVPIFGVFHQRDFLRRKIARGDGFHIHLPFNLFDIHSNIPVAPECQHHPVAGVGDVERNRIAGILPALPCGEPAGSRRYGGGAGRMPAHNIQCGFVSNHYQRRALRSKYSRVFRYCTNKCVAIF